MAAIAKKFLTDILANGPVLKIEIEEAAKANGIAERTLFRAKSELSMAQRRRGRAANGSGVCQKHRRKPPTRVAGLAALAALSVSLYVKVLILLLFVKVAKIANLSSCGSLTPTWQPCPCGPALRVGNRNRNGGES